MAAINVGLMGFGRIGRSLSRIADRDEYIRLQATSDTGDRNAIVCLPRLPLWLV